MSGEILFLAHRMPFPPDRGDKIRSHHILRKLAEIAPVHVATFAESEADLACEGELASLAASHCLARRAKPLPLAGIEALLRREPVSLAAFRSPAISRYVDGVLRERPIETIYVFSGQMGQYVPGFFGGRVLMDLVDVDSAKFEAYAAAKPWPMSWIDGREGRLLRAEEDRLARRADCTLLVSEAEAALLRSRLSDPASARVCALGNGIDAAAFDPDRVSPEPSIAAEKGPHLVFTGQMDYAPNVAAAQRVIGFILPAVRQVHPHAQFHVVGRAPVRELVASDGKDGVRIWGAVPDIRPFLAAADVVVVPLDIARGVQNKVLEAMAMARPIVLTPGAATGIDGEDGTHFTIAGSDTALASRVIATLADPAGARAMGMAARRYMLERQSWPAMLAGLPELAGFGQSEGARRDAA